MVAKNRKQSGKSPATQADRDRSPLVSPQSKSNVRRAAREGRAVNSALPNGLLGISHKLGLTPSGDGKIGAITLLLAVVSGFLHWYHLTHLFENDRHFSHLSTLEKEMAFRTEMGLYYSYYKTIIEAPSFMGGLHEVMNDGLTEYPLVINTLKRFNLYPEVVLASWYRTYTGVMAYLGIPTKTCWSVNRGEGLTPVDSCEGLGDPAYFYVACVFLLNGVMMSLFFLFGFYLSNSNLGGIVTTACFFFNHGESTRVMWTPPLRESFAYPFLVLQMLLLTYILRKPNPSRAAMVALGVSNLCFMLPWQFAQFVLLTQVASLFASYVLGYLAATKMQSILVTHMVTLAVCFVLMFGNSMLLTSFYASSLVSIWAIVALRDRFCQAFRPGVVRWVMQVLVWVVSTVLLKFMLSTVLCASDDAHISALIKSKFMSYRDFHTLMYTCAAEFDFLELETPLRYLKTLLLPLNLLLLALILWRTGQDVVRFLKEGGRDGAAQGADLTGKGELVYHSLQLLAFAILAILIMRLKLFLTPHMCTGSCDQAEGGDESCSSCSSKMLQQRAADLSINMFTSWNFFSFNEPEIFSDPLLKISVFVCWIKGFPSILMDLRLTEAVQDQQKVSPPCLSSDASVNCFKADLKTIKAADPSGHQLVRTPGVLELIQTSPDGSSQPAAGHVTDRRHFVT